MKNFLIVFAVLVLTGCGHSAYWDTLCDVDNYIEQRPDSALIVLQKINADDLSGREERAKHALLLSMALDKNYIDKTDFETLQPAIDYYEKHGGGTEKFLTHYYEGVISMNMNDYEKAMEYFLNAENHIKNINYKQAGRLYMAENVIYRNIFDYEKAIRAAQNAADHYYANKDTVKYVNAINKLSLSYFSNKEPELALYQLEKIYSLFDNLSQSQKSIYYCTLLSYYKSLDQNRIKPTIEAYYRDVSENFIDWLVIANSFFSIGEVESATESIEKYKLLVTNYDDYADYHAFNAILSYGRSKYQEAAESYKNYIELTNRITHDILQTDTKFIRERYEYEYNQLKSRHTITVLILTIVIAVLFSFLIIRYLVNSLKKKKDQNNNLIESIAYYKELYCKVATKKENLLKIKNNQYIDNSLRSYVIDRLHIINEIAVSKISTSQSTNAAIHKLELLVKDQNSFIESTKSSLFITNPNYMQYLLQQHLTKFEIGLCCLYSIGLNGSEIGIYLDRRAIYNISGSIRKKLGLLRENTNLDIFLQEKMKELD